MPSERLRGGWGATSTGSTPSSSVDTDKLDPDKYIGTLGLIEDVAKSSNWPNYTDFPAANKGEWLRVISNTSIPNKEKGPKSVFVGQEWMCVADKTTANNPSKWELVQKDSIFDRYIGTLGAIALAPTSNYPNFTTFPAAEKNDWVRSTSNSTINGVVVREGEEWLCKQKTLADTASNWELRAAAIPYSQLSRLDTSQYIGSLGLAKDAPDNAPAPHFTQFPAADKGDWIQIVSTFRANDLDLVANVQVVSGETWICNVDGTEAEDPDSWDRLIIKPKVGTLEEVGFYFLSRYDFFSIPTGVKTLVDFNPANPDQIIRGYYLGVANEISVVGNYINITPWKNYALRNNVDVYIDIEAAAYFESDANGDRNVSLLYWAGTLKNNVYDYAAALYLESQTNLPARSGETTAKLKVTRFKIDWIAPKSPTDILIHAISIELLQTSGIALPIRRCTITMSMSKEY